jgi:alkylation response protein AidB-like acyl-CoA dehydrogenase
MVALDGGRIGVGSQSMGIADAALGRARELALVKTASGARLADQQDVQFQLADVATDIDAAWLLTLRAAWMKASKVRFSREAAMAKAYASEAANRACRAAVQVAGGHGFLDDYQASRYLRDCRVTQIYEGTSEVQRVVISREVLKTGVLP